MECTLITILACFSWSNVYVDATTEYLHHYERDYTETLGETFHVFTEDGQEFIEVHKVRTLSSVDREVMNPYARASLGYTVDMQSLRFDVSAFYQESIRTHDKGEIGASVRVRWFPFR